MALVVSGLLNKQVGGTRHQRDHGEGSLRQSHAEDEGRFSPRSGENGWQARAGLVKSLNGFRDLRVLRCAA
jgi:hypothetical protein